MLLIVDDILSIKFNGLVVVIIVVVCDEVDELSLRAAFVVAVVVVNVVVVVFVVVADDDVVDAVFGLVLSDNIFGAIVVIDVLVADIIVDGSFVVIVGGGIDVVVTEIVVARVACLADVVTECVAAGVTYLDDCVARLVVVSIIVLVEDSVVFNVETVEVVFSFIIDIGVITVVVGCGDVNTLPPPPPPPPNLPIEQFINRLRLPVRSKGPALMQARFVLFSSIFELLSLERSDCFSLVRFSFTVGNPETRVHLYCADTEWCQKL